MSNTTEGGVAASLESEALGLNPTAPLLLEPGLFNPDKALAYSVLSSYFTLVQLFHREALEDVLTAALVSFLASSGEIATHSLVDSKPPPGGAVTACD
ncbi:hypothetical protein AGIG_G20137 [Arapaima gigas]